MVSSLLPRGNHLVLSPPLQEARSDAESPYSIAVREVRGRERQRMYTHIPADDDVQQRQLYESEPPPLVDLVCCRRRPGRSAPLGGGVVAIGKLDAGGGGGAMVRVGGVGLVRDLFPLGAPAGAHR